MSAKTTPRGCCLTATMVGEPCLSDGKRMLGQQKTALEFLISQLIDADEPEAMLSTMQRIAERMAFRSTRFAHRDECERWERLAAALNTVRFHLDKDVGPAPERGAAISGYRAGNRSSTLPVSAGGPTSVGILSNNVVLDEPAKREHG